MADPKGFHSLEVFFGSSEAVRGEAAKLCVDGWSCSVDVMIYTMGGGQHRGPDEVPGGIRQRTPDEGRHTGERRRRHGGRADWGRAGW